MKKVNSILIFIFIMLLTGCKNVSDTHHIVFDINANEAYLDGNKINEYDYVWHIDPKGDYDAVKDSPAEYYTGEKPDEKEGIWLAHDIRYFPVIDKEKFYKSEKDANPEWNTNYENEKYKDLVFASLPRGMNDEFPDHMMHTEEDAYKNLCLHITKPGTYELSGIWHGQIFVDLGKDAFTDPSKKINLILNNLELFCDVAPAINIYNAYECDNMWDTRTLSTKDIDLDNVGVNIILKDNTKNYIQGANVFRICKTVYKKNKTEQKKAFKYDGAINTAVSLNFYGETLKNGELHLDSKFEGVSSDLHLGFNGGIVYINADNDGINCSEDGVSILKINDGVILANSGLGYEGDALDSNGYIIINGGETVAVANNKYDPGIDSVNGAYINGGSIVALGEPDSIDWAKIYMNDNIDQSYVFKSFDDEIIDEDKIFVIDDNQNVVYTFNQLNVPYLRSMIRPFNGVLISNSTIKKDKKYNIAINH